MSHTQMHVPSTRSRGRAPRAPPLDTEVLHVLRRFEDRGDLAAYQVASARSRVDELAIDRYPHRELSERVWALRSTLSAYDATYVAQAQVFDATLATADRRLAGASGTEVAIEVY